MCSLGLLPCWGFAVMFCAVFVSAPCIVLGTCYCRPVTLPAASGQYFKSPCIVSRPFFRCHHVACVAPRSVWESKQFSAHFIALVHDLWRVPHPHSFARSFPSETAHIFLPKPRESGENEKVRIVKAYERQGRWVGQGIHTITSRKPHAFLCKGFVLTCCEPRPLDAKSFCSLPELINWLIAVSWLQWCDCCTNCQKGESCTILLY